MRTIYVKTGSDDQRLKSPFWINLGTTSPTKGNAAILIYYIKQ